MVRRISIDQKIPAKPVVILAGVAAAAAFATAAIAQSDELSDLSTESPATELEGLSETASDGEVVEELSELDALSRTTLDEIEAVRAQSKRKPVSVTVRALNKITAKYTDIIVPIDSAERFGSLTIEARFCDKRPPEEFPETTAFLQVFDRGQAFRGEQTALIRSGPQQLAETADDHIAATEKATNSIALASASLESVENDDDTEKGNQVFSGWMFASSPALHPLEHPVYDVWVIDCLTAVEES